MLPKHPDFYHHILVTWFLNGFLLATSTATIKNKSRLQTEQMYQIEPCGNLLLFWGVPTLQWAILNFSQEHGHPVGLRLTAWSCMAKQNYWGLRGKKTPAAFQRLGIRLRLSAFLSLKTRKIKNSDNSRMTKLKSWTYNHRITASFRLEKTLKVIKSNHHYHVHH